MHTKRLFLCAVVCLGTVLGQAAFSAGIDIKSPIDPVPVGKTVQLPITGVSVTELLAAIPAKKCSISCWPRDGVSLSGGFDLVTAGAVLTFSSEKQNQYLVSVYWHTPQAIEKAEAIVTVGAGPTPPPPTPPTPPTPPQPEPLSELAAKVLKWTQAVPAASQAKAEPLAKNFDETAAKAAAGVYPTSDAMMAELRTKNQQVMAGDKAWDAWAAAFVAEMKALDAAGKLPNAAAHAQPFRDVALGLRKGVKR